MSQDKFLLQETIQQAILVQLCAAEPDGLHRDSLFATTKLATSLRRLPEKDFRDELDYLESTRFLRRAEKQLSKARILYRITDEGIAYLDREGLI